LDYDWQAEMNRLEATLRRKRQNELQQLNRRILLDEKNHLRILCLAWKLFVLALLLIALGFVLSFASNSFATVLGCVVVLPVSYIEFMLFSGRYRFITDRSIHFSARL